MAESNNAQAIVAIVVAILIGAAISWAGSDGGYRVGTVPVFALCGALAYAINWLAFIPSALTRTERYYDLTGGVTYISAIVVAVLLSNQLDLRAALATVMVLVWSLRLATFLFLRISRAGHDSRFDDIKTRPQQFFMAWTLQGLWVLLTAAAALAVITGGAREPLGAVGIVGISVWAIGMVIEVVADRQKSQFKADSANEGKFVNVGLWAWSRHPNYFGEIVLWTGMAILALPVLQGWQWATLISPLFVTILLTRISGIPPLEDQADERWGGDKEYKEYKRRTPVLIPKRPARQ
jgi:steroid 5-alpha reductase family enzyme